MIVKKEVHICDQCGREDLYHLRKCVGCGLEFCEECAQINGFGYKRKVLLSDNHNIYFCITCELHPPESVKELLEICRCIKALRIEYDTWHRNFTSRSEKIDVILERLIDERCQE